MMNRRMSEMFMNSNDYAKNLEDALEKMYVGNKEQVSWVLRGILNVLEKIMDKGYLSFNTFKQFEMIKNNYEKDDCIIISSESEMITVLNKSNDTFDRFHLKNFISWLVSILSEDPLFRSEMKGHYDYAGMIVTLKKLSDADGDTRIRYASAVDAVTYGQNLYLVDEENNRLRLLKLKKRPESFMDNPQELMELSTSNIFQDRKNGWVYVNHIDGYGRQINMETNEIQKMFGRIVGFTNEEEIIVCRNNQLLICNEENDILERIGNVKDVILNTRETEGVSWISDDNGMISFVWRCEKHLSEAHSLKADFVWNHFLENAYVIEKDAKNKLSTILWKHHIYQTPTPFNATSIKNHIKVIEHGIQEGIVHRSELYIDTLKPILMENDLSKDMTNELFYNYGMDIIDFRKYKKGFGFHLENQEYGANIFETERDDVSSNEECEYSEDNLDYDISDLIAKIDAEIERCKKTEKHEKNKRNEKI